MIITNAARLLEGRSLPKITPVSSVKYACRVMNENDARALVVLQNDKLVGVISERDVVRKCVARGLDSEQTQVADIMTSGVKTIKAEDSLAMAIGIMQSGKFHHVPVIDGDRVLGLISSDDIPDEYRMLLERFREMRSA